MEKQDADIGVRCDQCPYEGVACMKLAMGENICEQCLYKAITILTGKKFLSFDGYIFKEPELPQNKIIKIKVDINDKI